MRHQITQNLHGATRKNLILFALVTLLALALTVPAFAANTDTTEAAAVAEAAAESTAAGMTVTGKAFASGIAIAIASGLGAISMGIAVGKSTDAIARQPEAESKIRTALMLGLVFIETAIIYALLAVILIIFVL